MEDESYMERSSKKSHIRSVNLEKRFTIRRFSHLIDAQLDKTKLESQGIECFVIDESIISQDWFYPYVVGCVKLQVNEADSVRAIEILRQTGFVAAE